MKEGNDHTIFVAAVCDKEVRIYGYPDKETGTRPLESVKHFPHHGAALLFAGEYEETQRKWRTTRAAAN